MSAFSISESWVLDGENYAMWNLTIFSLSKFFFLWRKSTSRTSGLLGFISEVCRSQTIRRAPPPQLGPPRRSDTVTNVAICTKLNKHKRKTSMTLMESKPAISAVKRPQNYDCDFTATGIGYQKSQE